MKQMSQHQSKREAIETLRAWAELVGAYPAGQETVGYVPTIIYRYYRRPSRYSPYGEQSYIFRIGSSGTRVGWYAIFVQGEDELVDGPEGTKGAEVSGVQA